MAIVVSGACGGRSDRTPSVEPVVPSACTGACGGKSGSAPKAEPAIQVACVPTVANVMPAVKALDGAMFSFCVTAESTPYCFTADLEARTLTASPAAMDTGGPEHHLILEDGPTKASIEESRNGKGLTVCTADKATCHDLPIAAASMNEHPMAVSDDATLVVIDKRIDRRNGVEKAPGRIETWDATTGKKLATFQAKYGRDDLRMEDVPRRGILAFLGHTVLAFTEPGCALPCSSATMYSVQGKYLGMLAADPTASTATHFHDSLYVLHSYGPPGALTVQDAATGKSVQLDAEPSWDAFVTRDRIVRVVGSWGATASPPRVQVWGPDLTLVTEIVIPSCAPGAGS